MNLLEDSEPFFDLFDPFKENEAQRHKLLLKEGERREVAILFADIKGSTALGSKLDPEVFNRILDPLMKRFSRCISYYGGYVDKYMGDGIMALFGARRASEQDTERAVMAALKMLSQIEWANRVLAEESRDNEINLSLRIGINTGLVVVGKVGEAREGDFTVIGSAVNLAQRMEANAPANGILMPVHAMQAVERFFEFSPFGKVSAKGFNVPIESFVVLKPRQERGQRWYRKKSVFIGREKEYQALNEALDSIDSFGKAASPASPKALVMGIMGDAGLGKTRLIHELHQANAARTSFFVASTSPLVRSPLNLFVDLIEHEFQISTGESTANSKSKLEQAMKRLAEQLEPEAAKELRDALPLIAALLEIPYSDPRLKLSGAELLAHLKLALKAVIMALFKEKSKEGKPIVLVLDDIHWIDAASHELMKYLLDKIVCDPASEFYGRVLALLLYREDYQPKSLELPAGAFRELALKPLDASEIARLLQQNMPDRELDIAMLEKLQMLSMGNPFYLEEWCNYLDDTGGQNIHDIKIPPNLHALVLSRLDVLDNSLRVLLQKAAVIGQQFFVDILSWIEDKLEYPLDVNETLAQLEQQAFVLKLLGFDYSAYFFNPSPPAM